MAKARLYTTALGMYEVQLNGASVSDTYFAPGWL
ncbi:alpha-L-rhamnosidase N-terminal domain-containing protein [Gemmiger formicilis]|nr:alpha-L-rhamnosidase N-terminal domain-containing protein [Gemmiger formicilis]MCQ5115260.1 alpha-L-rhamnosidase N-terminal domain-containing protein [Gemmiger formicilis]